MLHISTKRLAFPKNPSKKNALERKYFQRIFNLYNGTSFEVPFCILDVENICSLLKVGFCSTHDLMVAHAHKNTSFSSSLTRFLQQRMLVLSRLSFFIMIKCNSQELHFFVFVNSTKEPLCPPYWFWLRLTGFFYKKLKNCTILFFTVLRK